MAHERERHGEREPLAAARLDDPRPHARIERFARFLDKLDGFEDPDIALGRALGLSPARTQSRGVAAAGHDMAVHFAGELRGNDVGLGDIVARGVRDLEDELGHRGGDHAGNAGRATCGGNGTVVLG